MCKSAEETINCLLLHCPAAQELWSVVFILLGVLWVMPRGMLDLLASWQARFGRGNRVIWNVTPHYLMRCLWRERNARIFEECKKSFQIISFPSSKLYLSGWMLPLYFLLPLCLRCLIVVCFGLNFGVLLYTSCVQGLALCVFLMKYLLEDADDLWRKVIDSKYGID